MSGAVLPKVGDLLPSDLLACLVLTYCIVYSVQWLATAWLLCMESLEHSPCHTSPADNTSRSLAWTRATASSHGTATCGCIAHKWQAVTSAEGRQPQAHSDFQSAHQPACQLGNRQQPQHNICGIIGSPVGRPPSTMACVGLQMWPAVHTTADSSYRRHTHPVCQLVLNTTYGEAVSADTSGLICVWKVCQSLLASFRGQP